MFSYFRLCSFSLRLSTFPSSPILSPYFLASCIFVRSPRDCQRLTIGIGRHQLEERNQFYIHRFVDTFLIDLVNSRLDELAFIVLFNRIEFEKRWNLFWMMSPPESFQDYYIFHSLRIFFLSNYSNYSNYSHQLFRSFLPFVFEAFVVILSLSGEYQILRYQNCFLPLASDILFCITIPARK